MSPELERFRTRVRRLVARIPAGRVATYGQLSALAGHPRRARFVGRVLRELPPGSDLPWHRVINAQGRISPRAGEARWPGEPVERRQSRLLRAEGVRLRGGVVDLARYGWRPEEDGGWIAALIEEEEAEEAAQHTAADEP